MTPASCGCPEGPGRRISDPERHAAWHAQVAEQTGLTAGPVGQAELQRARGRGGIGAVDHAKREKDLRSGKSSPGWRRRAARDSGDLDS